MIVTYRLCSSRYPANSGKGAALRGGRWNPPGTEVIYTAEFRSLSALEILVQDAVLPRDFVITPVRIPDGVGISVALVGPSPLLDDDYGYKRTSGHSYFPRFLNLPPDWNGPDAPFDPTQAIGREWILDGDSAVLSVPSAIIPEERNYVLNVGHRDFSRIEFLPSKPFRFDPRLKPK